MTVYSIGDRARAFALQVASYRLKTTLATLTDEMASGETSDIGQRLQGNTQSLALIEARITLTQQFQRNASEAASFAKGIQDVLGAVETQTSTLGLSLVAEPFSETTSLLAMRADEVEQAFETVVSRLNGAVGGRYLFSGLNSDAPALTSGTAILDALVAETAGLTTANDVVQAVSDWFDAPVGGGGFLDVAYQGTNGVSQTISVAEGQSVEFGTTAADPALRDVLKGLATAALVGRGVLAGQYHEQRDLMQRGGQALLDNSSRLLAESARTGLTQQFIERAQAENSAADATLQTARNNLRIADPFETAGKLTQVESQLEMLYSVTARLSKLKLVDFLR
ncbi:hypothetical protein [Paracoccus marinaquae]|uniref:Flagellin n=1 Tax=Paracoccus marinaquae TaxID=2841926 RepID=A0ABS6AN50_9RHOB|nr:hypothetical protein [Paracoccus marinaquae]MBU3032028.1 hypothetical protein [Paracoccus marinaquae]